MRQQRRYPAKPIDRPDHISMLLPTRGRPENLQRLFGNLQATAARRDLFDVWLFVDDDDHPTLQYIAGNDWRRFGFPINWHVAPGKNSMGEMLNELWQSCTSNAGIYFPFMDDAVITTAGWDEVLRRCFSGDGFLLGYLRDPTALAFQVTIAIPSARWLNTIGYVVTDRFYFWFGDCWLDEIAQMADCKALLPIQLEATQGKGKTARMRNLPFWCRYFVETLPERYREACLILEERYGRDSDAYRDATLAARKVAALLMHKSYAQRVEEHRQSEATYRDTSKVPGPGQIASYLIVEAQAVEELLGLARVAADRQEVADLLELLETLELSSFVVPDLHYLKAEALNRLGYKDQALSSIERELELRPAEPKGAVLREAILAGSGSPGCYHDGRSLLRLPSWIGIEGRSFLLFPEQIDPELYFTLQNILYVDPAVESVLDIGAGSGVGSSRALIEAAEHLPHLRVFCIEPDRSNFHALSERHAGRATLVDAASVPLERYVTERELDRFYNFIPSIMNSLPLESFQEVRRQELGYLRERRISDDGIARIKAQHGIDRFGLVVLDGSMFCGEADLEAVYGARYLALNSVRSIKSYGNFRRLIDDNADYRLIAANLKSGCGYAVFAHR